MVGVFGENKEVYREMREKGCVMSGAAARTGSGKNKVKKEREIKYISKYGNKTRIT